MEHQKLWIHWRRITAPPSTIGDEFTMPSSATEQNAEVA
jgi:hypothetical protein